VVCLWGVGAWFRRLRFAVFETSSGFPQAMLKTDSESTVKLEL
jgi:hypothetical protein